MIFSDFIGFLRFNYVEYCVFLAKQSKTKFPRFSIVFSQDFQFLYFTTALIAVSLTFTT